MTEVAALAVLFAAPPLLLTVAAAVLWLWYAAARVAAAQADADDWREAAASAGAMVAGLKLQQESERPAVTGAGFAAIQAEREGDDSGCDCPDCCPSGSR